MKITHQKDLPQSFSFHHLGCACTDLASEARFFEGFGYASAGNEFLDINQGIKGLFLEGLGPRIELLENLPGSSTLTPWIDSGTRFYHVAYMVEDLPESLRWVKQIGGKVISPPTPAVAFGYRDVSFIIFKNRQLIEFISAH